MYYLVKPAEVPKLYQLMEMVENPGSFVFFGEGGRALFSPFFAGQVLGTLAVSVFSRKARYVSLFAKI